MTREEAIQVLQTALTAPFIYGEYANALAMAIEALSVDVLLKQEIDFHKEVSRIEAEKVVDLEHKLADMIEVVRCKDCRHAYYADNRVQHDRTWVCERFMKEEINANDFCSWGEWREE